MLKQELSSHWYVGHLISFCVIHTSLSLGVIQRVSCNLLKPQDLREEDLSVPRSLCQTTQSWSLSHLTPRCLIRFPCYPSKAQMFTRSLWFKGNIVFAGTLVNSSDVAAELLHVQLVPARQRNMMIGLSSRSTQVHQVHKTQPNEASIQNGDSYSLPFEQSAPVHYLLSPPGLFC